MPRCKFLTIRRLSLLLVGFNTALSLVLPFLAPRSVSAQQPPAPISNEIITTLTIEDMKDIGDADLDGMRGPVIVYWFDNEKQRIEQMEYDRRDNTTVYFKSTLKRSDDEDVKVYTGDWWVCLDEVDVTALNPPYDFRVEDTPAHDSDGAPDGTAVCRKTTVPSGETANVDFTVHSARYTAGSREKQCEGAIEWILCPMIEKLFEGVRYSFDIFISALDISPLRASDDDSANTSAGEATYAIWNNFRIIANIIFIIVFMVALFGQATGSIFSNYQIKRILPRLAVGVVGIQLSWFIVGFVIDFFNILGVGVRSLILAPIGGGFDGINISLGDTLAEESIVGVLLAKGVLGGFRLAGTLKGIIGFLPIVLVAILAFIVLAVAVVVTRALVITLLIVIAPIAFVAWVLPNTQGFSKLWWGTFWKLLFMYPLIVALIALGELSAELIGGRQSNDIVLQFASIMALFAPYFLIPQTFQYAGGVMAALANGFSNGRRTLSQKLFGDVHDPGSYRAFLGRQRDKYRTQQYWRNVQDYNAAMKPARLAWRNNQGRGVRRLGAAGLGYMRGVGGVAGSRGMWRGLGAIGRTPRMRLQTSFGTPVDERMAARNRMNREYIKLIGDFGDDDIVHAIAGSERNIFTGEGLSRSAANAARRFRDDDAMVQAAFTYLFTQAGSPIEAQELINQFDRFTSQKHLADFKDGMWLGVAFGSQGVYRDLKHRRPGNVRRYSFIADRLAGDDELRRHIANKRGLDEAKLDYRSNQFDVAEFTKIAKEEFKGRVGDVKMEEMLRESVDAVNQRNYSDFNANYIQALEEGAHRVEEILRNEAGLPKSPDESLTGKAATILAHPTGNEVVDGAARAIVNDAKLSDDDKPKDPAGSFRRDLENISKLRAGLIDMLARRELNVEDPSDVQAYGPERDVAGAKIVHWRKEDIRRELEERIRLGLERDPTITDQRLSDIQRQRISEIVNNNVFFGTLGAEQEVINFIKQTEWVHDQNSLRTLIDGLRANSQNFRDIDPNGDLATRLVK